MTPTAPELLMGCVTALSTPPETEDAGAFVAGKVGVALLLNLMCAQEAATGIAVRVAENAQLRTLLADAAAYSASAGEDPGDGDVSLVAVDLANAALRRRLIALHEAVETAGDADIDARIFALDLDIARRRLLPLPR